MIEVENPECAELLLGLPLHQNDFGGPTGWFRPSVDGTTHVLRNDKASFTFVEDEYGGLRLTGFQRAGSSHVWTNSEPHLWRAIVFDTTVVPIAHSTNTSVVVPHFSQLASVTASTSGNRSILTAVWSQVSVGNVDALNVTITLSLGDGEDWLQAEVSCAWAGTPTRYALDSLCWLPLRVPPLNRGEDYAVVPAEFGFLSKDPITYLRFDPADGKSRFAFQLSTRNFFQYPSGRGWSMGFWGYYETTSSEAWMVWAENGGFESLDGCWQSDGGEMLWEMYRPQEDNILVGNNSRSLGSAFKFCVRPLQITQPVGWWDIGTFYRERYDTTKPPYWVPIRTKNPKLSPREREPQLFVGVDYGGRVGSFEPLIGLFDSVRRAVEAQHAPIFGIGDLHHGLPAPFEPETSDEREVVAQLYDKRVYLAAWVPGEFMPKPWDHRLWKGGVHRWHTTYDPEGSYYMLRAGRLNGAGADDLAAGYRKRTYGIASWLSSSPTFRITVSSGNPAADGFTGHLTAVLIPASPTARLAHSKVLSLTATRINVETDFYDSLGNVVVPTVADTVVVTNGVLEPVVRATCPYAILNSAVYLQAIKDNTFGGRWSEARSGGFYTDVYDEPQHTQADGSSFSCYRTHTWSLLNQGYVHHPLGGGEWLRRARHEFIAALRQDVRARQLALGKQPTYWTACEDTSEATLDIYDYCYHTAAVGNQWRGNNTDDPENDQYLGIPLFSVVHSGRQYGRVPGGLGVLSNGALMTDPAFPGFPAPAEDDDLHRSMAYGIALEWAYGMVLPALSFFADDELYPTPPGDLWDESNYQPTGPAAVKVRQVRDLWTQLAYAELHWALQYLRFGQFMPLAVMDFNIATATQSELAAGNPYIEYAGQYLSYDVVYRGLQFPAVLHGIWRDPDTGEVCIFLVNWTEAAAVWAGEVSMAACGLSGAAMVQVERLNYRGTAARQADLLNVGDTASITVEDVPPFTMIALRLTDISATEEESATTTEEVQKMPMRKSTVGLHLAAADHQQATWLGANVGYRNASREIGLTSTGLNVVGYVWHKTDAGRSNTLWVMDDFVVPENVGIGASNGPVTVQYLYSNADYDITNAGHRTQITALLSAEQDQAGLRDDAVQAGRYRYLVFVLRSQAADSFISEWGVSQSVYEPISVGGLTLALVMDDKPSPGRFNIVRGTTPTLTFMLVNSNGAAFDATGGSLKVSISKSALSAQIAGAPAVGPITATIDVDPTTGQFEWIPTAAQTDQSPGEYVFEALWSRGSERARFMYAIEIEPAVTLAST